MSVRNQSADTETPVLDNRPGFVLSTFTKHLDDRFVIRLDSGDSRSVQLVEASASPQNQSEDATNFCLVFHDSGASLANYLPQASYALEHEQLGTHRLFLVPIGPSQDGEGILYEAVFASPT